ncbi:MAG: FIST N-terminal domain-containing protein [Opitutales bacterium]
MPFVEGHSVVRHFQLPCDEGCLEAWAREQRSVLKGPATMALVFSGSGNNGRLDEILEIVRIYAQVPVVAGASAVGLVANERELENETGFSVALYHLPDTRAHSLHLPSDVFDRPDAGDVLCGLLGPLRERANAWLLFASPESLNSDAWLPAWDAATGGKPTVGGFASLDPAGPGTVLLCDGAVHAEGAVALALEGGVTLDPIVAQGCRPVGDIWTVTEAENNIIRQIGNRPILEVLRDTLEGMSRRDQQRARGNIFIGVVHDEYKSSFRTGDFLVRNLAAIDPKSGAVAIATPLRVGQNLQFQIRDARSAAANLERQLERKSLALLGQPVYGCCLANCIGRGGSLFGVPDHDASLIREAFPGLPLSGLFCNGEFGPVGGRTLLHGYAASLGLLVGKP